jgi:uncharacterized protein involved in propanediol utilization
LDPAIRQDHRIVSFVTWKDTEDNCAMGTSLLESTLRRTTETNATAIGHAGEILQGAFRRADGIHRFLCSLPAPTFVSRAAVVPTPGEPLSLKPVWAWKAHRAAQLLVKFELPQAPECQIRLASNIPVAKGCGSSTADVVATLRALCSYLHLPLDETQLARLAVQAEGASDGIALSFPAVFRHREGQIEEVLPGGFPPMRVMVVDAQPESTVPTLTLVRPRYSNRELDAFEDLRQRLRMAFLNADPAAIGQIASASARLNQPYLPKPHLEEIVALVERNGGYGVAAAHSGTVLALLFPLSEAGGHGAHIREQLDGFGMPILAGFTLARPSQPEIWYTSDLGAPQGASRENGANPLRARRCNR